MPRQYSADRLSRNTPIAGRLPAAVIYMLYSSEPNTRITTDSRWTVKYSARHYLRTTPDGLRLICVIEGSLREHEYAHAIDGTLQVSHNARQDRVIGDEEAEAVDAVLLADAGRADTLDGAQEFEQR